MSIVVLNGLSQQVSLDSATGAGTDHFCLGTNAVRNGGVLHRSAIAAVDKLATVGTVTLTGVSDSGGSLTNTLTWCAVAPFNAWGSAGVPSASIVNVSPGSLNNAIRMAFAQVTGAVGYDIFTSTDVSNPKWVARITEAQRAAGGVITTVGGSPAAGGAAGSIDIGILGTGLQAQVNPFVVNNAYTPASITPVSCIGYSRAHVMTQLTVTDLRSLPTLSIVPFFANQISTSNWQQGSLLSVGLLTAVGQCLQQDFVLDVDGTTGLIIAIDTLTGQGAAVSVWVELM